MRQSAEERPRGLSAGLATGPLGYPSAPLVEEFTAGLAPSNTGWRSLGPGNIGGRIRSILIDPRNNQRIFIGSVGGGVWISSDAGQSWQPADDLMANLAVSSMAIDPTDPDRLYAGTGEGFYNGDAIQGDGIFTSNGGWVWTQLASTASNNDFRWVNALAVNGDATLMLAGTRTGIFSSANGGVSWTKRQDGEIGNIAFAPGDKTKAVAGLLRGGGIVYSVDGGLSWTAAAVPVVAGNVGRIQICYAAADASRVYASVENGANSLIWKSDDGGRTFTQAGQAKNFLGSQGWYDNVIWAGDPTNKSFVLVGGIDLWKSSDGGVTVSRISQWQSAPASAHADHHAIVADPGFDGVANKAVFFGNDGGIYRAADVSSVGSPTPTSGWQFLGSKLPITQFFGGAGNPATNAVIGGAQDNGTLLFTPAAGANAWGKVFGGDGGYVAADPANPNNFYGEYVYLSIFRNTGGGAAAATDYICGRWGNGWKPAPFTITDAQNSAALFIAPFVLDPNDASRLLAGGTSLWRTEDPLAPNGPAAGPSWTAIKPPAGSVISAITVAPGNSDLVLVGHSNGMIFRSINATAAAPAWVRIDTNGIGATRMCTWLAIDPVDNRRFYATFGGFQAGNLWTSADSGASWTNLSAALPRAPVRCIAIHPQNSSWLYVGTEVGIFASEDRGATWSPANEGPTNCVIYQLFWLGNTLFCVSHGRGMFSIDLTIRQSATLVVTAEIRGTLTAHNPATGAAVSTYQLANSQITALPVVDGRTLYCAYHQPFAICRYDDAGHLEAGPAWQTALGGSVEAPPALVKATYPGDPDLLYSVAADGKLYVLNASTGTRIGAPLQVVPAPQVGAGVNIFANLIMNQWAYVATDQGLYAVNLQTRSVAWSNAVICLVAPLAAANRLFVPGQDGKLHAFDARTGVERWSYDTGAVISCTPGWILGTVLVGNQSGTLVGLDYLSGAVQVRASFPGETINALAADGNEFYFAGNAVDGHLYGYRLTVNGAARSLTQIWSAGLTLGAANLPPPVGSSLFVTSGARALAAFDANSGTQSWSVQLASVAMAAPAIVYA